MTNDDINQTIDAYAADAKRCEEIGFDGIEIHGAHGYLIDNFLWEGTNIRDDDYGGSIENRARLATEIVDAWHSITEQFQFPEQKTEKAECYNPGETNDGEFTTIT